MTCDEGVEPPGGSSPGAAPDVAPLTCDLCGAQETDAAELLTWSISLERGRTLHHCRSCSRAHLRAMESKLDREWW